MKLWSNQTSDQLQGYLRSVVFVCVSAPCSRESAVSFGGLPAAGGRAPILWRGNCYTVASDCQDLSLGAAAAPFPLAPTA